MINRVVLVGRLVRDPELRKTPANQSVATFTVAVDNRVGKDKEKSASFIRVTAWSATADFMATYAKKGNLVGVDGRLLQGSYESNGQKITTIDVVADSVQLLESRAQQNDETGYRPDAVQPQDNNPGVDVADDDLPF